MRSSKALNPRERLVRLVQHLERLARLKQEAGDELTAAFQNAKGEGFDPATLKVVLKLRTMSPLQRQERRRLEAIYLAALGMLEGEALPEAARKSLDPTPPAPSVPPAADPLDGWPPPGEDAGAAPAPAQPALALKDPAEARAEGEAAAVEGKRIYDNPYPAGDPCRAAWDEGWCAQKKSNGMELPVAFQRRTDKPPKDPKEGKDDPKGDAGDDAEEGAA